MIDTEIIISAVPPFRKDFTRRRRLTIPAAEHGFGTDGAWLALHTTLRIYEPAWYTPWQDRPVTPQTIAVAPDGTVTITFWAVQSGYVMLREQP